MNDFGKGQLRSIIRIIEQSEKTLELAALQNDGIITKEEKKHLNKLKAINKSYIQSLNKLIGK